MGRHFLETQKESGCCTLLSGVLLTQHTCVRACVCICVRQMNLIGQARVFFWWEVGDCHAYAYACACA